jgi:non-specific serine/threonine protein kinase
MHLEAAVDFALRLDHTGGEALATAEGADGMLSPREREVAELIALGRSNREIAEALVLSSKTVESHIKHIFEKLGVQARAEVAVWATRQGLRPST